MLTIARGVRIFRLGARNLFICAKSGYDRGAINNGRDPTRKLSVSEHDRRRPAFGTALGAHSKKSPEGAARARSQGINLPTRTLQASHTHARTQNRCCYPTDVPQPSEDLMICCNCFIVEGHVKLAAFTRERERERERQY
ncbi:hypothetical protein EVAR_84649_1 [Eumeta japonica]|uniref:Uncharacterized protein n=1 Tax=Eumeta variegata TaxID=151549 RepID=A0A4C1UZU6_EUMVA|nr:hypothetical protein EVAR_84649_1 [Eumeta japonica]